MGDVKVKLNDIGWLIYKHRNVFYESNIDDEGYSIFAYDYFEDLFYPLPNELFSFEVKPFYSKEQECEGHINMALYELLMLQKKIEPTTNSNIDTNFNTIIDLLKEAKKVLK